MIPTDVSPLLRSLLLEHGSLTRRLIALSAGDFRVRLDTACLRMPHAHEARLLRLRAREMAWVREVTLMCRGLPAVYARSVIPSRALHGRFKRLRQLGTRPLGEFLFTTPGIHRGAMHLVRVTGNHVLHAGAALRTADHPDPAVDFWGRQSLFYIGRDPLLVTEVFLADRA